MCLFVSIYYNEEIYVRGTEMYKYDKEILWNGKSHMIAILNHCLETNILKFTFIMQPTFYCSCWLKVITWQPSLKIFCESSQRTNMAPHHMLVILSCQFFRNQFCQLWMVQRVKGCPGHFKCLSFNILFQKKF